MTIATARATGLRILLAGVLAFAGTLSSPARPAAAAEPAGFEHLHTYAEVEAIIHRLAEDHPDIVDVFSIGHSYEGREIWAVKISDNAALDEAEPEVMITALTHARERSTNELAMYLLELLTSGYGVNERITRIVDERETFVIPMLNPDGAEYDISGGTFKRWRKNRQPIPGSDRIGIDLNRNYGFKWGCCGGGSDKPGHRNYRGWAPWVAPEVVAHRDFVESRVVDARQQLRLSLNLHSEGRMILWPYAYTAADLPPTITADDRAAMVALSRGMAAYNGYRAMQGSELYVADGDHDDWIYFTQRVFAVAFEMIPTNLRYYPTRAEVAAEIERNRGALLYFLELADCPYRAAGREATRCGPLDDDFEIARAWQVNPLGTDTASDGAWARADARRTRNATGVKQHGASPSGRMHLVTGRSGGRVALDDVDGGTTSVRSPEVVLGAGEWSASFRYSFAHDNRATADDFLRVSVVNGTGDPSVVFVRRGTASVRNAAWQTAVIDLSPFAGQTVRLLVEVADGEAGNVVEAAIDDVRVYRTP